METRSTRLPGIDLLRGLAIVLMALDHTRGFYGPALGDPTDLTTASPALFFTRWLTHYCAPAFVFLAGTSAFLVNRRLGDETAPFLVRRGLWLMLLEVTWVSFSWTFGFESLHLGVLWAIGGAMVLLGLCVRLPRWAVGAIGAAVTLALALPAVHAGSLEAWGPIRFLLQPGGAWKLGSLPIGNTYVIVPWFGVMALGYGCSALLTEPGRRRQAAALGSALVAAFVVLRGLNGYGDPAPWLSQERGGLFTGLSFLDASKYPPSLDYLLMTLGPMLLALPLVDRLKGPLATVLGTFGRVPLFFYLLHLPLLHLGALWWNRLRPGPASELPGSDLWSVWGVWIVATGLLWWPCRAYDRAKRERRRSWMTWL